MLLILTGHLPSAIAMDKLASAALGQETVGGLTTLNVQYIQAAPPVSATVMVLLHTPFTTLCNPMGCGVDFSALMHCTPVNTVVSTALALAGAS